MQELAIFVFCLIGCGITSYRLGYHYGVVGAVEHLIDEGVLEVDDE